MLPSGHRYRFHYWHCLIVSEAEKNGSFARPAFIAQLNFIWLLNTKSLDVRTIALDVVGQGVARQFVVGREGVGAIQVGVIAF